MPIPDYQFLMLPVLRVTEDRQEYSLSEIRERIAVALQLSAADLEQRLVSNNQPLFTNRVAWAIQYLKAAKTIESIRRSIYRITDRGLLLLKSNPTELTVKSLRQFPEFLEFAGSGAPNPELEMRSAPQPDAKITPDESL